MEPRKNHRYFISSFTNIAIESKCILCYAMVMYKLQIYTERIKFSNFLKLFSCFNFEKYYNAVDHIQDHTTGIRHKM